MDGSEIGTVNFLLNASFAGVFRIFGLSTNMNGGSSVCTLNSLGNLMPGPTVVFPFGLLPAMRKLPCGVSVMLEWYTRAMPESGMPALLMRWPSGASGVYSDGTSTAWSAFEFPIGSETWCSAAKPERAPFAMRTWPLGRCTSSGIVRGSSMCSTSQPFAMPSSVRVMREHWVVAGVCEESRRGSIGSVAVPPQTSTSGMKSGGESGRRMAEPSMGFVTRTLFGRSGRIRSVFASMS